jgi:hypothetical protein
MQLTNYQKSVVDHIKKKLKNGNAIIAVPQAIGKTSRINTKVKNREL